MSIEIGIRKTQHSSGVLCLRGFLGDCQNIYTPFGVLNALRGQLLFDELQWFVKENWRGCKPCLPNP